MRDVEAGRPFMVTGCGIFWMPRELWSAERIPGELASGAEKCLGDGVHAGNAGIFDSIRTFSLGSELRRVNVYPCFVLVSAKYLNQAASGCVWTRHHTLECGCSICTLCSSATLASTIKLGEVTMEELVAVSWWQQILLFWGSSKVLFTWLNRCLSDFALYCLLKSRFVAISAMVLLNCKVDDLLSEGVAEAGSHYVAHESMKIFTEQTILFRWQVAVTSLHCMLDLAFAFLLDVLADSMEFLSQSWLSEVLIE